MHEIIVGTLNNVRIIEILQGPPPTWATHIARINVPNIWLKSVIIISRHILVNQHIIIYGQTSIGQRQFTQVD